ncbi:MAG: pH regulation protein F [Rhodospirillaceae bacterium]|nr:pH regulation protein F [Rhodospirillaceae bacterium]MBL6931161.1 pH regulation protein F [Rhodospirillales bacterium]MBL6940706.1 pH regulation protein F [Rhodospirillales bacterium]
MFSAATLAILISMFLVLVRALKGPTVYDRILAVNCFGTLTVLLISVYGFLTDRPEFLDIALVYALISFINIIAVSKFVRFKDLAQPLRDDDPGDI